MGMNLSRVAGSHGIEVFNKIGGIGTVIGGFILQIVGLLAGTFIRKGTLIAFDGPSGQARVVKTVKAQATATNSATAYKVEKGSLLAVGDIIGVKENGAAYAITGIDSSNAAYDEVTVGTTLGVAVAVGDVFFTVTTAGTATAKLDNVGLLYEDTLVEDGASVSVVNEGTVYERRIAPVPAFAKAKIPNVIFSDSY